MGPDERAPPVNFSFVHYKSVYSTQTAASVLGCAGAGLGGAQRSCGRREVNLIVSFISQPTLARWGRRGRGVLLL